MRGEAINSATPATRAAAQRPEPVYALSPRKDAITLLGTGAVVAAGYLAGPWLIRTGRNCGPFSRNFLDKRCISNASRAADVGSYLTELLAVAWPAVWSYRSLKGTPDLAEDLIVALETFLVNAALDVTVKTLVQRPQPRICSGNFPALHGKAAGYRAFYSGHTSQTTAMLLVPAVGSVARGERSKWPWLLAAAGSLLMSFQRVRAGRHFYSDVAVGTLVGVAVGIVVPGLHLKARSDRRSRFR